jgi:hypothetical protein
MDLAELKQDVLRVIDAGANRDERDRLEREVRALFDRASAVPTLIAAKERYHGALCELVNLKAAKDAGFKTYVEEEAYRARKVRAWERARDITMPASDNGERG